MRSQKGTRKMRGFFFRRRRCRHVWIKLNPYVGDWMKDIPKNHISGAVKAIAEYQSENLPAWNYVVFRCEKCGEMRVEGVHTYAGGGVYGQKIGLRTPLGKGGE